jgi:hypothetical protein
MSIDRLRAHYGFSRMPFGNYAEAATMPRPGSGGPCRAGIVTSSVAAGSA